MQIPLRIWTNANSSGIYIFPNLILSAVYVDSCCTPEFAFFHILSGIYIFPNMILSVDYGGGICIGPNLIFSAEYVE